MIALGEGHTGLCVRQTRERARQQANERTRLVVWLSLRLLGLSVSHSQQKQPHMGLGYDNDERDDVSQGHSMPIVSSSTSAVDLIGRPADHIPEDTHLQVMMICTLLGISVMFPWNAIITALDYFASVWRRG